MATTVQIPLMQIQTSSTCIGFEVGVSNSREIRKGLRDK